MLIELAVENLGIIADARLEFGPGMTALTGETGAGKTLLVQSMQLLVGARAEGHLVGPRGDEAVVEGRFEHQDQETVVRRVISSNGRSKAYLNGSMVTLKELTEVGSSLVDLHSQHAHQALLSTAAQRHALDQFGGIELEALHEAKSSLHDLLERLDESGGDERARLREMELLRFQVEEIVNAALEDLDEEQVLAVTEGTLGDAAAHKESAAISLARMGDEGGAIDQLGEAVAALRSHEPFTAVLTRIEGLLAELSDTAAQLRDTADEISVDPAVVEQVRVRRQLLRDLCRKYGDDLGAVADFGAVASKQLRELEHHEEIAAALEIDIERAKERVSYEASLVADARRIHCQELGSAVQARFESLGMANAYLKVTVGEEDPGDDVQFLFEANSADTPLALAKVASGGELARIMLALRLVLSSGPPTMIFDEADAGIGGSAALSVGRALGELSKLRQVIVVTHLPQVAAAARTQVSISKDSESVSNIEALSEDQRLNELARMLSGNASEAASEVALKHASELITEAQQGHGS